MEAYVREIIGLSVLAGILLIEIVIHGRQSRRLREYGFLALATAIGVLFCLAWDFVTFRISPGYFAWGKGLAESPLPLGQATAWLAVNAGWRAGLLIGAVFLFANGRSQGPPRMPFIELVSQFYRPILGAIIVGAIGGLIFWFDPFGDWHNLPDGSDGDKRRFLIVQGLHLGGYLGGAIGTAIAVRRIRGLP